MMFMTAKVDFKKIAVAVIAAIAVILALALLLGGNGPSAPTAAPSVSGNDGRVAFLQSFGWEVAASPAESGQVKIPEAGNQAFDRYNALQKSQGYDLSQYAGKAVMRYVYKVNNYPGATDPVYATVLVYKNQVIGGDVTNTAANGAIQGFAKPSDPPQAALPETTVPDTTGAP